MEKYMSASYVRGQVARDRKRLFQGASSHAENGIVDTLVREGDSHRRSRTMVNRFIAQMTAAGESLTRQGDALRGARRGLLDMARSLGVSQGVVRWVDQRATVDRILLVLGGLLLLVLILALWYFRRGGAEVVSQGMQAVGVVPGDGGVGPGDQGGEAGAGEQEDAVLS